ncbi:hypothetical protein Moror_10042 [Moniliophthora roreri MCA 2997]|uniref:DUF590-domain-containing protein n=1 Tax=Moniliophthora roreri (strain MCA 2997) TaxID=1381753 RepID=V2Y1P4_MONRO|nr:hypothetical protein Moror_10042 [Moniliophthora roreri MCA 2997]
MPETIPVDLVISFRTSPQSSKSQGPTRKSEIAKASEQYKLLINLLTSAGFKAVGRRGESLGHILVFVSCPEGLLRRLVKNERDTDFLSGLPVTPISATQAQALPIAPADRIRIIYEYIISGEGLGITPESKQWTCIEKDGIMCLHDKEFNDQWIHAWTTSRTNVGGGGHVSLERVRQQFGESIAVYFAFLNTYTHFLAFPACLGLSFYFLVTPSSYSPIYSSLLVLWSIIFVEYWRVRERLIAVKFGTLGSFRVEKRRIGLEQNGKKVKAKWWQKELKVLASVPVITLFAVILGLVMTGIFILEAFVGQLYMGPGQKVVAFSPTVLFILLVPRIVGVFQACTVRLTIWENHSHQSSHDKSLARKTFVFTALVAYLGLALSAFVYVPFGEGIMRVVQMWLYKSTVTIPDSGEQVDQMLADGSSAGVPTFFDMSKEHKLDSARLRNQMFAYTVTNQIVNTFQEVGLPFILRKISAITSKKSHSSSIDSPSDGNSTTSSTKKVSFEDERPSSSPAEKALLSKTLHELSLPPYDVFSDYSEMIIQFGYVALWSTIWPLAPVMALLNNILEIRSDAFKITTHVRRPIPLRTESIGPWLEALTFLTWLAGVTNGALVWLFCPRECTAGGRRESAVDRVHRKLFDAARAAASATDDAEKSSSVNIWADSAKATIELLGTALLVALIASHVYSIVRFGVRHVVERVVWGESREREEKEREERSVRSVFLKGLVSDGVEVAPEVKVKDMGDEKDFWEYEEGEEEIGRILKEA